MPYFGVELHDRGPERVFARYSYVDHVCASLVRRARRTLERPFEMRQVLSVACRVRRYV